MFKPFLIILFNFLIFTNLFSQDFEVAPVKMIFSINSGETQSKILTIKNHSNFKTSFNIVFEDFLFDKDGVKVSIEKNSSKSSCSNWVTPEKSFFDINPNEEIELKVTMHVPNDDYTTRWTMMYIQTVKEKTSFDVDKSGIGAGVNLSGRIGVQVYRYPATKVKPIVSIKNIVEIPSETKDRVFSTIVNNEGTVIANCKVIFVASDLNSGEEIEFDPIYFDSYPGYKREIQFTLPSTIPPGKYSFAALLDYGKTTTIKGTRLKKTLLILPKKDGNGDK